MFLVDWRKPMNFKKPQTVTQSLEKIRDTGAARRLCYPLSYAYMSSQLLGFDR